MLGRALAGLLLAAWSGSGAFAAFDVDYTLRWDKAFTSMSVEACFPADVPPNVAPDIPRAVTYLTDMTPPSGGQRCARYTLDLQAMLAGEASRYTVARAGGALVVSPDLLLWHPEDTDGATITATFVPPEGHDVATQWPRSSDAARHRFVLDQTVWMWASRVVLGPLQTFEVSAGGTVMDVVTLGRLKQVGVPGLTRWLEQAARASALVHGQVRPDRVRVVISSLPDGDYPVVFGVAFRGGGAAVVLLVREDATEVDLMAEWVAIHELFHLSMPHVRSRDLWLSEGVTMYYSETLRGRLGILAPQGTWQRLEDGFARGRRSGSGLTNREECERMHQSRAYHRVYWFGAAVALMWDVALRWDSDGRRSLDDAIAWLGAEHLTTPRRWSADEMMAALDQWYGKPLFSETAERVLNARQMPNMAAIYRQLGVTLKDGRVSLQGDAPLRVMRDAIGGTDAP